jgi:hypothetical protein
LICSRSKEPEQTEKESLRVVRYIRVLLAS